MLMKPDGHDNSIKLTVCMGLCVMVIYRIMPGLLPLSRLQQISYDFSSVRTLRIAWTSRKVGRN